SAPEAPPARRVRPPAAGAPLRAPVPGAGQTQWRRSERARSAVPSPFAKRSWPEEATHGGEAAAQPQRASHGEQLPDQRWRQQRKASFSWPDQERKENDQLGTERRRKHPQRENGHRGTQQTLQCTFDEKGSLHESIRRADQFLDLDFLAARVDRKLKRRGDDEHGCKGDYCEGDQASVPERSGNRREPRHRLFAEVGAGHAGDAPDLGGDRAELLRRAPLGGEVNLDRVRKRSGREVLKDVRPGAQLAPDV